MFNTDYFDYLHLRFDVSAAKKLGSLCEEQILPEWIPHPCLYDCSDTHSAEAIMVEVNFNNQKQHLVIAGHKMAESSAVGKTPITVRKLNEKESNMVILSSHQKLDLRTELF